MELEMLKEYLRDLVDQGIIHPDVYADILYLVKRFN